ncbi:MFS transporter [Micromonospora sp. NPDC049523]|uniref:MFS transporter n=1 Tax=Micromonospora sp. NPDC049523 TaxID=3155921 RepID=UPI003441528F
MIFWILALIEFISVIDASAVNVALPSIGSDLDFSPTTIAWVIDAYIVGFAGFMLLAGRATDIVGRRRLFVAGVVLFAVFSLACALSVTPWQLVTGRLLQGLGAAVVTPAALALITDIFPEGAERNRALGIFSGMAGLAAPVGLVLGGLLTSVAWQGIFLINLPICLVVLVAALRLLPRTEPGRQGRLDILGAVAVTGGLILLILAVLRGSAQGWTSVVTLTEFTLAGALLVTFVLRQLRGAAPLLPTELFARRNVVVGNMIFSLVGAVLIATLFFVALFLQQVRGYSAMEAAFVTLPVPLAMLAGTQAAPRLLRFGPPNVLAAGLVVQALALGLWAVLISDERPVTIAFAVPAAVWAFGVGMSIVSSFVVCTMGVSGPIAGAASGLATTTYQAGGALGLAILAVVADSRTAAVTDRLDRTDALVSGYSWALTCALGAALLGAVLTRFIVARHPAGTAPDRV